MKRANFYLNAQAISGHPINILMQLCKKEVVQVLQCTYISIVSMLYIYILKHIYHRMSNPFICLFDSHQRYLLRAQITPELINHTNPFKRNQSSSRRFDDEATKNPLDFEYIYILSVLHIHTIAPHRSLSRGTISRAR